MCGRHALKATTAELIERFILLSCPEFGLRFNIAPQSTVPVIRQRPEAGRVGQFDAWLDTDNHDTAALAAMLGPCRADLMAAYPVSPAINSGRAEGPACIEPVESE